MTLPSFDALGTKLYPLLDWFVPESIKAEAESLRRARMFLISHLFGPFLGHTISLYILFIQPHPDSAWLIFFGVITLFWAFPIALKLTGWYVPLALVSVQNLIFTILWGCYHYGGTSSPLIPWVITVPLLAFFYLGSGKAVRMYVLSIILVNLAAFYGIYSYGNGFPELIPPARLSGLGLVSTACAALYVSMMALYYANIATSQSELEREVKRRMETARQLREAADEADRANRAKSEFLAKMSHELRTPLNAVIGYSAIMLDEMRDFKDERCADLKKIHNAGKRLLKLITDLLDLSKLEAGKMELFVEPIEVAPLINGVIDEFREQIAESGNELSVECDPAITIEGDQIKLRRTIFDLVSNAVKFTTDGKISVLARSDGEWLWISVNDTGIGIESDMLPFLFESFKEFEDETCSKYGEAGLGLPVSQRLCRLMGGRITVSSASNRGSSFTIRVPAKLKVDNERLNDYAPISAPTASRDDDKIVLIIDDDPTEFDVAERVLVGEGYIPLVALNAAEGLAVAAERRPALILLDVLMPERDGWEVLKMLKADARLSGCPVVMLTIEDNSTKSRALGADGHIVKPLNKVAFQAVMREIGLATRSSVAPPVAAGKQSPRQAA
ncbi:MAG TPA: ATP-binding protein [Stellaceae bacterium]|jgi:signal transduction histidine kinase/CheY-like chemotaxis protein|nr:ATP-binding protein [Stellaceae bacterium]